MSVYALSINSNIIDKPDRSAVVDFSKKFSPIEATIDTVAEHILRGHAIAPQYRGGHRNTGNFMRSGFLAADVADGMTLEEAEDHAFVRHQA